MAGAEEGRETERKRQKNKKKRENDNSPEDATTHF